MIFKRSILNIILIVFLILCADGKREKRRPKTKTRTRVSSSSSSNESTSDSPIGILGALAAISFCGCSIGWKIFKCQQKQERRERIQRDLNNLIDVHNELLQRSSVNDHFNEKNVSMDGTNVAKLSTNKSNELEYIWIPLSTPLFNDVSDKTELEQSKTEYSICPQQTTNKGDEENFSVIVPVDNVKIPSHIN
ncbi:unnamed protein product [Adineta steineri]|nr:unnamed protein product [Adineta steineri]